MTSRDGVPYGYDGAGRQFSGPNRTVEYNGFGLPKLLTWGIAQGGPPRQTEFLYDSYGTRVIKRDQEQSVVYIGGLFERRAPAGAGGTQIHNLHNIVAEGRTVLQLNRVQAAASGTITSTDLSYLHSDLQGTTTLLTGANGRRKEAGVEGVDWELFYDPWGRRIDADYEPIGNNRNGPVRQGYTGHEHEDEYGLVNMQGRIYDPEARRFLTADPFIPSPLFSQSHNRYTYVRNNPASLVDPTGFTERERGARRSRSWRADQVLRSQPQAASRTAQAGGTSSISPGTSSYRTRSGAQTTKAPHSWATGARVSASRAVKAAARAAAAVASGRRRARTTTTEPTRSPRAAVALRAGHCSLSSRMIRTIAIWAPNRQMT